MLERYSPWIIECLVPEMEWETSEARKNHWNGRMLRPPVRENRVQNFSSLWLKGFHSKFCPKTHNESQFVLVHTWLICSIVSLSPKDVHVNCLSLFCGFSTVFFAKFRADVVTLEGLVPGPEVLSLRRSYCSDGGVPCVPCRSWSEISWDFNGFDMCFDMFW